MIRRKYEEGRCGEARAQIEYLHGKFQATGTGNAVIARLDKALEGKEG